MALLYTSFCALGQMCSTVVALSLAKANGIMEEEEVCVLVGRSIDLKDTQWQVIQRWWWDGWVVTMVGARVLASEDEHYHFVLLLPLAFFGACVLSLVVPVVEEVRYFFRRDLSLLLLDSSCLTLASGSDSYLFFWRTGASPASTNFGLRIIARLLLMWILMMPMCTAMIMQLGLSGSRKSL